jgi:hypothetical protein
VKAIQPVTFQLAAAAWPMQLSRACCCDDDIPLGLGCRFRQQKAGTVRRKNRETGATGFRSAPFGFVRAAIKSAKPIIRSQVYMRQSGAVFKPHARVGPFRT